MNTILMVITATFLFFNVQSSLFYTSEDLFLWHCSLFLYIHDMELSISRYMNSICICHFLLYEKAKKFINMLTKKKKK